MRTDGIVDCRSLSSLATAGCKAMFVINIITERSRFDVNVTPDKRTVMIQQMPDLLSALHAALSEVWDPSKWQFTESLGEVAGSTKQCDALSSRGLHPRLSL
jgi:DNA mismatch repair ATPase MutL